MVEITIMIARKQEVTIRNIGTTTTTYVFRITGNS